MGGAVGVVNSEVQVEIVRTALVFSAAGERRREIEHKNGDNGMICNGLKNFKKFKKVLTNKLYVCTCTCICNCGECMVV